MPQPSARLPSSRRLALRLSIRSRPSPCGLDRRAPTSRPQLPGAFSQAQVASSPALAAGSRQAVRLAAHPLLEPSLSERRPTHQAFPGACRPRQGEARGLEHEGGCAPSLTTLQAPSRPSTATLKPSQGYSARSLTQAPKVSRCVCRLAHGWEVRHPRFLCAPSPGPTRPPPSSACPII